MRLFWKSITTKRRAGRFPTMRPLRRLTGRIAGLLVAESLPTVFAVMVRVVLGAAETERGVLELLHPEALQARAEMSIANRYGIGRG